MAKNTKNNTPADVADVATKEPEMTTNTKTQSHELTFAFESNDTGTSHRLVAYHNPEWVAERDLSVTGLSEGKAALEMFAKAAAGNLSGSPKLLITAPTDKLGFERGTGTVAYVRYDFRPQVDAVEVAIGKDTIVLDVDPRDVPDEGYQRLHLLAGTLYSKTWERPFTVRDENPHIFWYCYVGSLLLEKDANVSVSVGPKLMDRAKGVMEVIKSDNPEETNNARMYGNRQSSRVTRNTHKHVERFTEQASAATAEDFEVPAAHGGMISLRDWPYGEEIHLRNKAGFGGRTLTLENDTLAARLAAAIAVRSEPGMTVDIS